MTTPAPDLLSGRAAAAVLGAVGIAPAQAQVALAAGLAGAPIVIGRLTYFSTTPPGDWWSAFEGRRFGAGRGTSWTWWPRPAEAGRITLERRQSRLAHG